MLLSRTRLLNIRFLLLVRQTQGGLERRNIVLVDSWQLNRLVTAKVLSQVLPLKIRHPLFDGFLAPKIMEKEHLKIRKPLILLDLSVLSQLYPMGIPQLHCCWQTACR